MQDGKRFKVVAADARPHLEGRVLRQRLIKCGIACTYILLNAVACVIPVRSAHHPLPNVHIVIQASAGAQPALLDWAVHCAHCVQIT